MGIKIKGAQQTLTPLAYETGVGILLAQTKLLETLVDRAVPVEDTSEEDEGFDEIVCEALSQIETQARVFVTQVASFRSALNNRPKYSVEDVPQEEASQISQEGAQ